jgi:hypothetical protein
VLSDSSTSTTSTDATGGIIESTVTNSVATSLTPVVITTVKTISGSVVEQTYTTTPTVAPSTSPSLNSSGGSSESPGLSPAARNTIIGVVVGVGGAILLLGIAAVVWRFWGRKKRGHDNDEDDLMNTGTAVGTANREMAPTGSGTPFQSTLDQYHQPVNAASNF